MLPNLVGSRKYSVSIRAMKHHHPSAANAIPGTVLTYLRDHAPKGDPIGYWLDKQRYYNVLILHRNDGEFSFSVGAFPETVGHWGHELTGGVCGVADLKRQLDCGFWEADAAVRERAAMLIEQIESGVGIDAMIALCRAVCDPGGVLECFKPRLPLHGPRLTNEGQFHSVAGLVQALADGNAQLAAASAGKLAAMGINENDGPLFAREALRKYRKRREKTVNSAQTDSGDVNV
jgi:hypothetical protein